MVYGYVLDPPSGDHGAGGEQDELEGEGGGGVKAKKKKHSRTYRLEKTYGVSSGKW